MHKNIVEIIAVLTKEHAREMWISLAEIDIAKETEESTETGPLVKSIGMTEILDLPQLRVDAMDPTKMLLVAIVACNIAHSLDKEMSFLQNGEVVILKVAYHNKSGTYYTYSKTGGVLEVRSHVLAASDNPILQVKLNKAIKAATEISEICLHVSAPIYDKIERRAFNVLRYATHEPYSTLEEVLTRVTTELREAIAFYEN